ncbi:hypothetical protein [Acinetobacter gyllenbergii]|uniref:hypothetical protein n=1 Tax=Acinetobacter gyllenbergii TaxID=134534 RepID=UPI000806A4A1|nr:hypothetical protein [Acinetobacter gyllenbergii]
MFKTKLEKKIRRVCWFFFFGIFLYLLIAFLLLSKYPLTHFEFDLVKSYEVLKDGLTISATFLASVVAFVLFSHWSEQHSLIRNENDVTQLLKETKEITNELEDIQDFITSFYERGLTDEELEDNEQKLKNLMPRIHVHFNNLKESEKNFRNQEFHKLCCEMHQKQLNFLYRILALVQTCRDLEDCKININNRDALPGLILQEQQVRRRYFEALETYSFYSEEVKNQIEKLADEHRIR